MISSSPERGTFQIESQLKQVESGEQTAEAAQAMIDMYSSWQAETRKREADPKWQEHNMEYDLRATDWIVAKARESEGYAQNLYAALCNNDFQKNDVWPQLKNQTWSCSWRYAGGIIADIVGRGDYMDWYCSGITGEVDADTYAKMSTESQERHNYYRTHFVGESVVTEEVREDLFKLGWIVVTDDNSTNI
jgi:hypothetical protein